MIKKRIKGDYPKAYRPCRLSEVFGQQKIKEIVNNGLNNGTLAHSLFFYGPSGTGKTSLCRIIGMGLNCLEGPTSEPCCECDPCKSIMKLNFLSYREINTADKKSITFLRKLRDDFASAPFDGLHQIYVFDEGQHMSKDAQNMLLKEIEDSGEHNYFIFCSTPDKIIEPLEFRCMPMEFSKIPPEEIMRLLCDVCECEGVDHTQEVLDKIVNEADGMARNALYFLQQAIQSGDL